MAVPAGLVKGDEDEFGVVLGTQWPARRRLTGAQALAAALLVGAAREAGLTAHTAQRITPAARMSARRYLAGGDGTESIPLPVACNLAGVSIDRLRRAVRQRFGLE